MSGIKWNFWTNVSGGKIVVLKAKVKRSMCEANRKWEILKGRSCEPLLDQPFMPQILVFRSCILTSMNVHQFADSCPTQ
jgi:hypothetical protein